MLLFLCHKFLCQKEVQKEEAQLDTAVSNPESDNASGDDTASDKDEDVMDTRLTKALRNKLKLLRQNKLSPSAATWKVLQMGGFLPDVTCLIGIKCKVPELTKLCQLTELQVNQDICCYSDPTNEGHSTILCANVLTHIVKDINNLLSNGSGQVLCKFEVFPVVQEWTNKKENKLSDYTIFRIYNRVTYIIIEVKLAVGFFLTAAEKDHLAQLFLEAAYVYEKEGKSKFNSTMLCILTDGNTWHLITTDLSHKPFEFKSVWSMSTSTNQQKQWDSVSDICDLCTHHVKLCSSIS